MRRALFCIGFLISSSTVFAASPSEQLNLDAVPAAFYTQMGTLKTDDGKLVSDLFAADAIQQFSGSEGSLVRFSWDNTDKNEVDVVVTKIYGHHGEPNGLTSTVTYALSLTPNGNTVNINKVVRTESEVK